MSHGMAEPAEAWVQFNALAGASSYADELAFISHAAGPLPDVLKLPVVAGVAGLMTHLEISPALDGLCRQLAEALDGLLNELDLDRSASVAAVLALAPSQRSTLLSWTMVVQSARLLLLSSPRSAQIMHIGMLCNMGLAVLVHLLRGRLQQLPDPAQAPQVTSPLGYGLTVYTDAARRLNEALGVVAFADPPQLGAGVDAS